MFSKLDSKCWPSEKAVVAKSRNFVKWALTEGHLTSRKDAPAASAKICRSAYAVEEEAKMAEDNDNANTDGTSSSAHHEKGQGEEGEGREEEEHEDEERAIHEKDFVSWLKRLSSKGNVDSKPRERSSFSATAGIASKRSAILTPLERCKSTIAKKGAFIASFREVNLGDGGGDLTVEQYEALILEHFLVYCAASKIDRSILTDFDGLETADTRAVEDAREKRQCMRPAL